MKKYISFIISVLLIFSVIAGAATTTDPMERFKVTKTYDEKVYNDIPANEWYVSSVKQCYELSLMMGNGDGTFNPNGNVTIAEAITMASRVNNIYMGGNGVFDTSGTNWYDNIVKYAESAGVITKGEYTNFDKAATRAELATIFASALPSKEYNKINEADFVPDISKDSKLFNIILKLYRSGIVIGSDEKHNFFPDSNIKRCEAAAIICRVAVKSSRVKAELNLKNPTPEPKPETPDKPDDGNYSDQEFEELPDDEFFEELPPENDEFEGDYDPNDDYDLNGSSTPLFTDVEEKPWSAQHSESKDGDIVYTIKNTGIHGLKFTIFAKLDKELLNEELNFEAVRIGYVNMNYETATPSFIGKDVRLTGEYTKVASLEELDAPGMYYTEIVEKNGYNYISININFAEVDAENISNIDRFYDMGKSSATVFIMAMEKEFCEGGKSRFVIIERLEK